jgi:putative transcriptional regulator
MIKSRLAEIAEEQGISIRELARDTDCHYETMRKLFNDSMERYPRDMLDKLCKRLGVTPGDLIVYVNDEEAASE